MKRTSKFRAILSALMLAMVFVFGAAFLTACDDTCKHENMEAHEATEATCTQTGNSAYWSCPDCGKLFADEAGTEELSALPEIAKKAHEWEEAYKNDENGYWHKCRNCDATSASEAHIVVAIGEEKAATCTQDGITAGEKCSICNYVIEEQKTLSKLEHKLTHFNAKEANCSSVGNIEYWYCERCEGYFTDEAATQKVVQAATVTEIDPSAHKFGEMQADVAATCTTAGTKAYKDCEYCKKHFDAEDKEIADLTIDELGHSYTEIKISAQPEKLTYFVGEDFEATGMEVTATCTRCPEQIPVSDYTLSGNTSLEKGAKTVTVTWGEGEQALTANVSVSVYEKHDLLQEGSYADFVYAASGDLMATAKQFFGGTRGKLLYNGTEYEVAFSGAALTLKEATVKGLLGEKTYGDFVVTLITDSFDQYEMSIAIVTMVIDSADDLTTITQTNQETALVDGYYIVTADFDAAEAGIQMSGTAGGNTWSAKAVSFASIDSVSFDASQYYDVGFKGIFDGRGHTIGNLNTFAYKYRGTGGLFGQLLEGSVVRNIAFTDVTVNGRYGAVLVGETCAFDGLLENVVITVKGANLTNTTDTVKILWALTGGEIKNCLFVGVDTVGFGVGDTDATNVMYVAEAGRFDNSGTTKYDALPVYTSMNAMFAALKEENVLSGWNCGITYADGTISFNGKVAAKPVIVISYECENNEVACGASVTFMTDDYVQITLKESVEGVAVEVNVLHVARTVAENTEITVLVTSTLNAGVTQEIVFKVIRAYQDVSIETALDFSLEGESSSVQAEIEGSVERIVAGETQVTEGISVSEGALTLTKAALTALLNGKAYAEGLTVNIYTSADKNYTATVNIVTKVIDSLADLESIRTTGDTLDGYFILGQSFTANNDTAMQKLIETWSSDANKGFVGIFDGRGHSITGLKLTNQGLFRCMGSGIVRNLALIDVYVEGVDADTASVPQYTVSVFGDADCKGATFENLFISTNAKGMIHNVYGNITMKNIIFVSSAEDSGYLSNSGGSDGGSYSVENALIVGTDEIRYYGGTPVLMNTSVYDSVTELLVALNADSFTEWDSLFTYSDGAIFFNGAKVLENSIA